MIEIWHEVLVGGIWTYASQQDEDFKFYVPPEYDLGPDFPGMVVIDPSDPDFAKKVFTVNFNHTQTASDLPTASQRVATIAAADSSQKKLIQKIAKTAKPGFGPGINKRHLRAYIKKRLSF